MSTDSFRTWIRQFGESKSIEPLRLGMSMREVEEVLGPPDKFDLFWQVDGKPREMVYDFVRLHFTTKNRLLCSICDDRTDIPSAIACDLRIEIEDS